MDRAQLARLLGASPRLAEPPDSPTIVSEPDPSRFMAAFASAVASGGRVFLADPAWGSDELAALAAIAAAPPAGPASRGWLMIPSGGTSGRLKFARHDEETLASAVVGYCGHFGVTRVNSLGVLPLHHVSGLMAWLRAALTGGEYLPWDWKRLENGERPEKLPPGPWFLSLVPTQLQRLISPAGPKPVSAETAAWLRAFDALFIGGGPLWPELADAAARLELPLAPGYGMTETAAMAAALRPGEFLAGARDCGSALPHVRLDLTPDGLVRVAGESVFRGYYPEWSVRRDYVTEDLGRIDDRGRLSVLGRRDAVIITGGKKVDPAEVEAALRSSGEFADLAVVGVADAEWGQAVVACYPAEQRPPDPARVAACLRSLAAFKRPRRLLSVADWPRNAQGKLNRAALAKKAGAAKL